MKKLKKQVTSKELMLKMKIKHRKDRTPWYVHPEWIKRRYSKLFKERRRIERMRARKKDRESKIIVIDTTYKKCKSLATHRRRNRL